MSPMLDLARMIEDLVGLKWFRGRHLPAAKALKLPIEAAASVFYCTSASACFTWIDSESGSF